MSQLLTPRRVAILAIVIAIGTGIGLWLYSRVQSDTNSVVLNVIGEDYSPMQGLEKMKGQFEAQTGIRLNITRVDAETLRKRYIAEFQAHSNEHDVIMGQAFDVGLLGVNGWTLNVSDALRQPGWKDPNFDLSRFSDRLLDLSVRYKGTLYGLPFSAQCMFLWFRKDLFENKDEQAAFLKRYGYPLPQPTAERSMTWAQYRDVAEFFTRPKGTSAAGKTLSANLYGTVLQAKNHIAIWFEFQNFLNSFGGQFIAPDGNTVTADSPQALAALQYYMSLRRFAPPGTTNYSWDEALQTFQNGQAAMMIMWSDSISAVEDPKASVVAGEVGFGANPTLKPADAPVSVFGGWGLFINKESLHPKQALLLTQWINEPANQVTWAKAGGFPAALSAYDSPALKNEPGMAAHREALMHLVAWTRAPYSARLVEIGQNHLAQALANQEAPQVALSSIAGKYREILHESAGN